MKRVLVLLGGALAASVHAAEPAGDWNFRALLDGEPIGQHRFSVVAQGDGQIGRAHV